MAKRKTRRQRSWHKKTFLHPVTVFALMCIGVAMIGLTIKALALNVTVVAKVSAPPPSSPAIIRIISPISEPWLQRTVAQGNNPKTALFTNTKAVTLTGDCPAGSHILVYRNNIFVGATSCIGDPTFSITIDLVPGLNLIRADVYNITNDQGPASQPIYLDYEPPPSQQPITASNELKLSSDFDYLGFLVGQRASWDVIIRGGTPPYKLSVNWGDGKSLGYSVSNEGTTNIRHTYQQASGPEGFPIHIEVTDASGQEAELNLVSLISKPNSYQAKQVAQANAALHPSFLERTKKWLWAAWPAYVVVLLMMISFWLGEREEYYRLVRKLRRRK